MSGIGPTIVGHGSRPFLRDLRDRLLNAVIGTAAAQIAAQPVADIFGSRIGMLVQKGLARNHEARSAKTALRRIIVNERLLNRMQLALLHQGLDRGDLLALGFDGQHRTRIYGFVIYQHGAGTTFRTVAYALSAGDVEFIRSEERRVGKECMSRWSRDD